MRRAGSGGADVLHGKTPLFQHRKAFNDPPGKRTVDDPARPSEKRGAATQGPRGRCADPPGDDRTTGSALLPRADRADPVFEPAPGAATDRRSREAARRCPAGGEADRRKFPWRAVWEQTTGPGERSSAGRSLDALTTGCGSAAGAALWTARLCAAARLRPTADGWRINGR